MHLADRATTLIQMNALRGPVAFRPRALAAKTYIAYWQANRRAESDILDIVELAYVLRADGFPAPEVFERLRNVYGLPGSIVEGTADPLRSCIVDYTGPKLLIRNHFPSVGGCWWSVVEARQTVPLSASSLNSLLALSQVWFS